MRTTEEAIRAVPRYIRWGAYGLGATKWQVVSKIVAPFGLAGIATGIVLAIGRAIGETAWCSTPWARPSIYLFRRSIPVVP